MLIQELGKYEIHYLCSNYALYFSRNLSIPMQDGDIVESSSKKACKEFEIAIPNLPIDTKK